MKKYFTKNNLIIIALSLFYGFIILFTGLCLDGAHRIISSRNPIAMIASGLGLTLVTPKFTGFIMLALVAIYVPVFVAAIIYETNYSKINRKKVVTPMTFLSYFITLVLCVFLSFGIGILVDVPWTSDSILLSLNFIGQSFGIGSILFIFIMAFVGGIVLFFYALLEKVRDGHKNAKLEGDDDDMEDILTDALDINNSFDKQIGGEMGNVASSFGAPAIGGPVQADEIPLDDREKVFPGLCRIDNEYNGFEEELIESDPLSLSEIATKFRNYLAKKEHLYFDEKTIRFFLAGFLNSELMILEGLSGTGKSSLPRYFAKFTNSAYLFIPVQSSWRDKTSLFGYFNDFSKTYSETDLLLHMYRANYQRDKLFIFVLDEMNISRVEYYFADVLSVMEYPIDEQKIRIMQLPYNFVPPTMLDEGILPLTHNCTFIGTANKDDSTFMISDKVYDRATVINFTDRNEAFDVDEEVSEIHLGRSYLDKLMNDAYNNEHYKMSKEDYAKFFSITDFIRDRFAVYFGNRILNQIDHLVPLYTACGGKKEEGLDYILSGKILNKLEGRFEDYIKPSLIELRRKIVDAYGEEDIKESLNTIDTLIRGL